MSLLQALGLFFSSFVFLLVVFLVTGEQSFIGQLSHGAEDSQEMNEQVMGVREEKEEIPTERLIGQLVFLAFRGTELSEEEWSLVKERKVGGAFLVQRNIEDRDKVEALVNELAEWGVVVAVDQEGGAVSRLPWVENTAQSEIQTEVEALSLAKKRGEQLHQLGIRMNLAPVVSAVHDDQSYLGRSGRAFGHDSGGLAAAMVKGYLEGGIIPVVKHFPGGLGRVAEDPHQTLPELDVTQQQLEEDLEPFRAVIAAQAPAIMVTHILYSEIDEMPASASQIFMDDILKDRLGFTGLVMADDVSMRAVTDNYDVGEYAVESLRAGADLVLVSDFDDYGRVVASLAKAIEEGELGQEQLRESYDKVQELLE